MKRALPFILLGLAVGAVIVKNNWLKIKDVFNKKR